MNALINFITLKKNKFCLKLITETIIIMNIVVVLSAHVLLMAHALKSASEAQSLLETAPYLRDLSFTCNLLDGTVEKAHRKAKYKTHVVNVYGFSFFALVLRALIINTIWKSKKYGLKTKMKIYNSNVKSVLLYGSECWCVVKTVIDKVAAFHNS